MSKEQKLVIAWDFDDVLADTNGLVWRTAAHAMKQVSGVEVDYLAEPDKYYINSRGGYTDDMFVAGGKDYTKQITDQLGLKSIEIKRASSIQDAFLTVLVEALLANNSLIEGVVLEPSEGAVQGAKLFFELARAAGYELENHIVTSRDESTSNLESLRNFVDEKYPFLGSPEIDMVGSHWNPDRPPRSSKPEAIERIGAQLFFDDHSRYLGEVKAAHPDVVTVAVGDRPWQDPETIARADLQLPQGLSDLTQPNIIKQIIDLVGSSELG